MDPCEDICHNKLKNAGKGQQVPTFVCVMGRHWIVSLPFPFQDVGLVRIRVRPGQSGRLGTVGARAEGADGRSRMLSLDSEGPSLPREVSRAAGPQMQSRAARTGSGLPGAHNLL